MCLKTNKSLLLTLLLPVEMLLRYTSCRSRNPEKIAKNKTLKSSLYHRGSPASRVD